MRQSSFDVNISATNKCLYVQKLKNEIKTYNKRKISEYVEKKKSRGVVAQCKYLKIVSDNCFYHTNYKIVEAYRRENEGSHLFTTE